MQTAIALILLCGAPPLLLLLGYLLRSKVQVREAAEHRMPDIAGDPAGPLAQLLQAHGRPAFRPRTESGEHGSSHFGGRPWLLLDEDWPTCRRCHRPLRLLLQLDLDALPTGAPPQRFGGLAQVFVCTEATACEPGQHTPSSTTQLARVVDTRRPGARAIRDLAAALEPGTSPAPATIVAWERGADLPGRSDCRALGLDDAAAELAGQQGLPRPGDKLGGWPRLPPGGELPRCPRCDETMEFVFQLETSAHLRGAPETPALGHLSRCRTHSTTLAFKGLPG